jgi:hypothetical protein
MGMLLPAFSLLTRLGTQQCNKGFDLPMKKAPKRGCNEIDPAADDATKLSPIENEQMLHRCIFSRGRAACKATSPATGQAGPPGGLGFRRVEPTVVVF